MKALLMSLLLTAGTFVAFTQIEHPETVRLHLLHQSDQCFSLKTHLNAQQPIRIAPHSYIVLEFAETHLGIIQDINFADQMTSLEFEKGKDYYFRISAADGESAQIDELPANTFKMALLFNRMDFYPPVHRLSVANKQNN